MVLGGFRSFHVLVTTDSSIKQITNVSVLMIKMQNHPSSK